MKTPELKPCPFCGGKASLDYDKKDGAWFIVCNECSARSEGWCHSSKGNGMEMFESITRSVERAIECWNRRATDENA